MTRPAGFGSAVSSVPCVRTQKTHSRMAHARERVPALRLTCPTPRAWAPSSYRTVHTPGADTSVTVPFARNCGPSTTQRTRIDGCTQLCAGATATAAGPGASLEALLCFA